MKKKKLTSLICVILAILMILSLVFSVIPASAYADNVEATEENLADLKSQQASLKSQVQECQERLEKLKEQQSNVLEQKAALDVQIQLANEQLELVAQEIEEYDKLIEEKAKEVEEAKNKEEKQLARYQTRVRAMEESGGYNILSLIVNADSFAELLSAMDDMSLIMQNDRALQEAYVDAREETEAVKAQYEDEKAEYEATKKDLEDERAEIAEQIQANTEELESLQDEIDKAVEEYEAAESAEQSAAATIANMVAALAAKKAQEAANNSSSVVDQMNQANANAEANGEEPPYSQEDIENAASSSTNIGNSSTITGSLVWPVPCSTRVTSRYGTRTDPFTGKTATHNGLDIDGFNNEGNIIVACAAGTVITSSYDSSYGNYVIIDHGEMTTLYAHMSATAVSVGTYVSAGQTIGYLGQTGRATGVHCHLEIFVNGSRVDPASYFTGMTYYNC
jgi:murein DD-endopeptidase MepM/ murein hydrolase activator NlpD